jgi:hypothetical protein
MHTRWLLAFSVAAGVLATQTVDACGDKLAALGGGVRFERIHSSRYPASIVLYLKPGSALRSADEQLRLTTALERVGHKVRSVSDLAELDVALQETKPDLVLMGWRDAQELVAHVGQGGASSPPVLRVLYQPSAEETRAAAGQGSCVTDAGKKRGFYLVKSVEDVLGKRHKGEALQCS